jgi:hypothetical protein
MIFFADFTPSLSCLIKRLFCHFIPPIVLPMLPCQYTLSQPLWYRSSADKPNSESGVSRVLFALSSTLKKKQQYIYDEKSGLRGWCFDKRLEINPDVISQKNSNICSWFFRFNGLYEWLFIVRTTFATGRWGIPVDWPKLDRLVSQALHFKAGGNTYPLNR